MTHIVIIGAGITGITSAYSLLERGFAVTVVDRHRYPAMETSFANGGQLSACNSDVWNTWSNIRKGIAWMFRNDAPLLVNPAPSLHKYRWLAQFCRHIIDRRENTVLTTELALRSREELFRIAATENIEFDLLQNGILHLYYDKRSFDDALETNVLLKKGGLVRYPVTPTEITAIEPTLVGSFYGGMYTESDSTGDIHKFTQQLAGACVRRGASIQFGCSVTAIKSVHRGHGYSISLESTSSRTSLPPLNSDAVLICAGVDSRALASSVGDQVNIYPVKGYSITVNLADEHSQSAAPQVSLLDESAKIVSSRLGRDRLRVAGTAEFNGFNRDIRADRIEPLLRWVQTLFPDVALNSVVPWAGLRPMMPNMMPRVGRGKRCGIYYNTGHGHLGWTLSAATATLIADIVSRDVAGSSSYKHQSKTPSELRIPVT